MISCRCHSGASIHITTAIPARVIRVISRWVSGFWSFIVPPQVGQQLVRALADQFGRRECLPGDGPLDLEVDHEDDEHRAEQERRPVQTPRRRGAESFQVGRVGHRLIIPLSFRAMPPPLPSAAARAIFTSAPGTRNGSAWSPHVQLAHVSHKLVVRGMTRPPSGCS
jgi:hypothetical protein